MKTLSRSSQPDRAHQLALGAFAAVEQQPVAAAAHEHARAARAVALGTEPPVPAKNSERSMRATVAGRGAARPEAPLRRVAPVCSTRGCPESVPSAPVAQWIERSPPEREVASSNLAGRVAGKPLGMGARGVNRRTIGTMHRRLAAVVLAVVIVALALSAEAGAGPPASCVHHKCDLTYYAAAQALKRKVLQKLRPRLPSAFVTSVGCGPTKHHTPGFARCTTTIEAGGLPAPCTVEALLSRSKGTTFRVLWWKESQTCEAQYRRTPSSYSAQASITVEIRLDTRYLSVAARRGA